RRSPSSWTNPKVVGAGGFCSASEGVPLMLTGPAAAFRNTQGDGVVFGVRPTQHALSQKAGDVRQSRQWCLRRQALKRISDTAKKRIRRRSRDDAATAGEN